MITAMHWNITKLSNPEKIVKSITYSLLDASNPMNVSKILRWLSIQAFELPTNSDFLISMWAATSSASTMCSS